MSAGILRIWCGPRRKPRGGIAAGPGCRPHPALRPRRTGARAVAALLLCGAVFANGAYAVEDFAPSEQELNLLPPYCKARIVGSKAEQDRWMKIMGQDFRDVHHYCFAMNFMRRAAKYVLEPKEQAFNYSRARTNFDYVFKHTEESFILRPEIHVRYGDLKEKLGEPDEAVKEYRKAIMLREDYAPAYAALSDLAAAAGRLKEAKEVLESGLAKSPESRSLKRRLVEIDAALGKQAGK